MDWIRLGVFFSVLIIMLLWERIQPLRLVQQSYRQRWPINLGLALLNAGLLRVSLGAAAWSAANWALTQQVGLFNWLALPHLLTAISSLLLLDLAIYGQHLVAHRWQWLWRLHQVHHSDMEFDSTTALRFHPLEILLSMLYKVAWVLALGVPPLMVLVFEVLLNACALFNHANISLPARIEPYVRALLVTPDMHRIHHSTVNQETDSNYGFCLSCWDRLFNSYCAQPQQLQTEMPIGLKAFRDAKQLSFLRLLTLPFRALRTR